VVDTVNMNSSRSASPARPYHHGRLREGLVEAGLELARAGGPDAVVLRAVSRQAGVSHNAAYRHFADHRELLAAVSSRCMHELGLLMDRRVSEVGEVEGAERARASFAAIGRAYIEFALSEPGWFRTAFAGVALEGLPEWKETEGLLDPYAMLGARLDELVAAGILPVERRPGAEYAAWSAVHGLATLLVEGPLRTLPPEEVERALQMVLGVVSRGI